MEKPWKQFQADYFGCCVNLRNPSSIHVHVGDRIWVGNTGFNG